jgi:hypothetical protein
MGDEKLRIELTADPSGLKSGTADARKRQYLD